jgi:hypothetical protein
MMQANTTDFSPSLNSPHCGKFVTMEKVCTQADIGKPILVHAVALMHVIETPQTACYRSKAGVKTHLLTRYQLDPDELLSKLQGSSNHAPKNHTHLRNALSSPTPYTSSSTRSDASKSRFLIIVLQQKAAHRSSPADAVQYRLRTRLISMADPISRILEE